MILLLFKKTCILSKSFVFLWYKSNIKHMLTKDQIKPGVKFMTRDKFPRECEVIDILTTRNSKNEITAVEYLCQHEFIGQKIKHLECAVTIQRGFIEPK